jgi:hypothetical protein
MDTNQSGIPTGPIDREPRDHPTGHYPTAADQEAILRSTLQGAGVELGEYDERIVAWFAQFADWGTFAVVTSWVQRASQGSSGGGGTGS